MKTVAVLSRKGGCGKTLLSHLLSYGLSARNQPTIMLQTDVRAEMPPEDVIGREYLVFGINGTDKDPAVKFEDIVRRAHRMNECFLVVDGGANRRNVDFVAAYLADLVLIPCGYNSEDCAVAQNDLAEVRSFLHKNGRDHIPVAILLNRWPGNARKLGVVSKKPWLEPFLAATEKSRLDYVVPDIPSIMDIAYHPAPSAPLNVKLQANSFADTVMAITGRVRDTEPTEPPVLYPLQAAE